MPGPQVRPWLTHTPADGGVMAASVTILAIAVTSPRGCRKIPTSDAAGPLPYRRRPIRPASSVIPISDAAGNGITGSGGGGGGASAIRS